MKIDPERLKEYAAECRRAARALEKTAEDLTEAGWDNISQGDVDLSGIYAARAVSNDIGPILERMT